LETSSPLPISSLIDSIVRDKKRSHDKIVFIIIKEIGKADTYPLQINKLEEYLNDLS
jgi:3-dehydroquinate synthetase